MTEQTLVGATAEQHLAADIPAGTFISFDDTDALLIPTTAAVVSYYADGRFANLSAVLRRCPHALVMPILPVPGDIPPFREIVGWQRGVEIDIENTDWTPEQAPQFVKACLDAQVPSRLYCDLNDGPAVVQACTAAGIARDKYMMRVAHWTGVPHLEPGYESCQYTNHADGVSLDASLSEHRYNASWPAPPHDKGHGEAVATVVHGLADYSWQVHPVHTGKGWGGGSDQGDDHAHLTFSRKTGAWTIEKG